MKAKLSVIILSFNTQKLTQRAVKSVLEGEFRDIQVVVVDNGSHDDSGLKLTRAFWKEPRFVLIARDVNDGFAAGNNIALAKVKTPYVMLLNSDAFFDAKADINLALAYMDEYPEVAVVTPKVLLGGGRLDPASHRGFPTPWNAFTYFSGLEKFSKYFLGFGGYHQTWADLNTIHEVDAVSGAAMIVRTSAMEKVGLLDEQFFMYGEDLDWCFRFKEKGFKVMFFPQVIVHHDKHTSGIKKVEKFGINDTTHEIQLKSRRAFYEAMRLFYNKHYQQKYPAWVRQLMFAGIELVRNLKGH